MKRKSAANGFTPPHGSPALECGEEGESPKGDSPKPRASARGAGFTLMEVMITVIVIGILATIAVPQFGRAIRRGQMRAARDVLLTIYAGEQAYKALHGNYVSIVPNNTGACPYTFTNPRWADIYMDDPNLIFPGRTQFQFYVTVSEALVMKVGTFCAEEVRISFVDGTFTCPAAPNGADARDAGLCP